LPLLFDVADAIGLPASAPRPIAPAVSPGALQRLERAPGGPRLMFPPDGAVVIAPGFGPSSRGLALAAGGEGIAWYVDGSPIAPDPETGRAIWRPMGPGFYRVTVVDRDGRKAEARVRIREEAR
jgi:penicillin-binding protein 1C